MSHKRQGQFTVSGEWAKHLRPLHRREFWKQERQAAKEVVRAEVVETIASAEEQKNVTSTKFIAATPVLASLDINRSTEFFASKLGFTKIHDEQGVYGIVSLGSVRVHFWACADRKIAEATSCRIQVEGIDALYQQCLRHRIIHSNAPLVVKPWGSREFAILDVDGNLVTFFEEVAT